GCPRQIKLARADVAVRPVYGYVEALHRRRNTPDSFDDGLCFLHGKSLHRVRGMCKQKPDGTTARSGNSQRMYNKLATGRPLFSKEWTPMNILFIHGAWMTPLCWEKFAGFFDSKGVRWQAPAWPYKDAPIETLRAHPDPNLAGLGITEIVDHYDRIIRGLPEPPVLIGHSFGGLFTQMLLDRGLGAAGIAIDSAPPKGVNPFRPTVFRANLRILATPGGLHKIIQPSFADFQYGFANNMPQPEQRAAFDRYVVPESGRPFFQS